MTYWFLPKPDRAARQRDYMLAVLKRLDNPTITDLLRRAQEPASDSYPSSHGRYGDIVSGSSADPDLVNRTRLDLSNNAEGIAVRPEQADPVGQQIAEVFALLKEAEGALYQLDRKVQAVLATGDAHKGRQSELRDCLACDRPVIGGASDPIRVGFCSECSRDWYRKRDLYLERVHGDEPAARALFAKERPAWQEPRTEQAS